MNADRADAIRARFERAAATTRAQADAATTRGDHAAAAALLDVAASQERMAAKRYETMRVVGSL